MKVPKLDLDDLELGVELLGQLLGEVGVDAFDLAGLGIAERDRIVERELADPQLLALGHLEQPRLRLLRLGDRPTPSRPRTRDQGERPSSDARLVDMAGLPSVILRTAAGSAWRAPSAARRRRRPRRLLDDLAVVHEDGARADMAREAHLVRDHQHGHAFERELAHDQQHLAAQFRIERRGRPRRTAAPWATWRARGRSPRAAAGRRTAAPDRRRACPRGRPWPAASRRRRRPGRAACPWRAAAPRSGSPAPTCAATD